MSTTPPPGQHWNQPPPPPPVGPQGTPVPPGPPVRPSTSRRGRAGFAAAVLTGALVVGGGAGIGGAALWHQIAPEEQRTPATSETTTAKVVDQGDTPAEPGSVEAVAAEVLPSVVQIHVRGEQGSASGSGIILSSDGRILTNHHVVELAEDGGLIRVSFHDGTTAEAQILGTDRLTDTAVIQAQDVDGLAAATIGSSENLDVGQKVVAVGAPFGLESTVTSGIVSALDRPVNVSRAPDGTSTTYPAIQTDAAINPGNSGGPLVDMTGAVVGINSSIRTAADGGGAGSIGLGFAIPIDEVMPLVEQMSDGETPTHARLGIRVVDAEGPEGRTGAGVARVGEGTAAADAGLERGDVIVGIDDSQVSGINSLVATIRSYRPGDTVTITFVRDGEEQTAEITLGSDAPTA